MLTNTGLKNKSSDRPGSNGASPSERAGRGGEAPRAAQVPSSAEQRLLDRIHERWGRAISLACATSSVPCEFLAALIANESGGDAAAARFEPKVFDRLARARAGHSVPSPGFRPPSPAVAGEGRGVRAGELTPSTLAGLSDAELRLAASSLGLTQVMGYHALVRAGERRAFPHTGDAGAEIARLFEPEFNLKFALSMLSEFAERFGLDLRSDFEDLFRCWNTGRPDGKTFDPGYAARGVARIKIYGEIRNQKSEDRSQKAEAGGNGLVQNSESPAPNPGTFRREG